MKCTFAITKVMKTVEPGKHQQPTEYYSYQENGKLCVVNCHTSNRDDYREYSKRTHRLILSYAYPHKPIMSTTMLDMLNCSSG